MTDQNPYAQHNQAQQVGVPRREWYTEDELDRPMNVVEVVTYGQYTKRTSSRKEVEIKDFKNLKIEVPADFHNGHVKLSVNRTIKHELQGIRAKVFYRDKKFPPAPLKHKRRLRDFMSQKGIRENTRKRDAYMRELESNKSRDAAMAQGIAPAFVDDSQYGADGLPALSSKTYAG